MELLGELPQALAARHQADRACPSIAARRAPGSFAAGSTVADTGQAPVQRQTCLFRPCIDIHQGKVKQIVGSSLTDLQGQAAAAAASNGAGLITNFVSDLSAAFFAQLYRHSGLRGGHVVMLGAEPRNRRAAFDALMAYPGGLHVGGGITAENAALYLDAGASHVIVTSHVFQEGRLDEGRLAQLVKAVGRRRLVLDLSCRKRGSDYFVVTDRWQRFSNLVVNEETLQRLGGQCDEFLVHGVDVEGKRLGVDAELIALLGAASPLPVTYAGGVSTLEDLDLVREAGRGRVGLTVGSALDIFGGALAYREVLSWHRRQLAAGG